MAENTPARIGRRRINWIDAILFLCVLGCCGYLGYYYYQKQLNKPAEPPAASPVPVRYGVDVVRRSEMDRLVSRMMIKPEDWSTVRVLPHPRFQGQTQDEFMRSCADGELAPLVLNTKQQIYVEGLHDIPKDMQSWLDKRKTNDQLIFIISYKGKAVYWDMVPPVINGTAEGLPWVHHVVDDVITTMTRWMNQR